MGAWESKIWDPTDCFYERCWTRHQIHSIKFRLCLQLDIPIEHASIMTDREAEYLFMATGHLFDGPQQGDDLAIYLSECESGIQRIRINDVLREIRYTERATWITRKEAKALRKRAVKIYQKGKNGRTI